MKYISELQGIDKVGEKIFLPHSQMETPLYLATFLVRWKVAI